MGKGAYVAVVMVATLSGCGGASSRGGYGGGGFDGGVYDDGGGPIQCGGGQALCNGACIDVTADPANCGACGHACRAAERCIAAACRASKIEHVVLIVEENHTFDAYFGLYCRARAGSNPACTEGPSCCEAAPATEPRGARPILLDDVENFARDRDHDQACELQQIHGGRMDGFVTGSSGSSICAGLGPHCSSQYNFALSDINTVGAYWNLAAKSALADRYFQPIAGSTASNNMYFAVAQFQFKDNDHVPMAIGHPNGCPQGLCLDGTPVSYQGRQTIADLLLDAGKTFTVYADGYAHAAAASPSCESVPGDCYYSEITHPVAAEACKYDASDIPFLYYSQFADSAHVKDHAALSVDLAGGELPSFAFVKAREFRNEHPNVSTISDGIAFVSMTIDMIEASPVADSTLILLTWDEGGGFFDHVSPPQSGNDGQPYGTRVPFIAIGPFARANHVSHVTMEHSSVVTFLEFNFLGSTGQLGGRDRVVHNIGSLLDPNTTGIPIPD